MGDSMSNDRGLGFLYRSNCYGGEAYQPYAIARITARRVFVHDRWGEQYSFDRATLERDGRAFRSYGTGSFFVYTKDGMEKEIAELTAEAARRHEEWCNLYWPLLRPPPEAHGLGDETEIRQRYEVRTRELPPSQHAALAAERDKAIALVERNRREAEELRAEFLATA
jgi:hypothetical protein